MRNAVFLWGVFENSDDFLRGSKSALESNDLMAPISNTSAQDGHWSLANAARIPIQIFV